MFKASAEKGCNSTKAKWRAILAATGPFFQNLFGLFLQRQSRSPKTDGKL